MEHHIVMDRPGVYRIAAKAPQSLVGRLWRILWCAGRQPEPTRCAPTLAHLDEGSHLIPTIAVSLAALRKARPGTMP
jgi:hypothetical protein